MKNDGSKKNYLQMILAFLIMLQANYAAVAIASSCTVGDLKQGKWVYQEGTSNNCNYVTGPPYTPGTGLRTSGKLNSYESIQGNHKFIFYTTTWYADPRWPIVNYTSGSPGVPGSNEQCWYFAELLGYPPQIASASPTEGLYSASKWAWQWTDKNCNVENTPNPDPGDPTCPQVLLN